MSGADHLHTNIESYFNHVFCKSKTIQPLIKLQNKAI